MGEYTADVYNITDLILINKTVRGEGEKGKMRWRE